MNNETKDMHRRQCALLDKYTKSYGYFGEWGLELKKEFCRAQFLDFMEDNGLQLDEMDVFMAVADYYARWAANAFFGGPPVGKGLFICGNAGSGKTTLAFRCLYDVIIPHPRVRDAQYRDMKRSIVRTTITNLAYIHMEDPFWVKHYETSYGRKDFILDEFGKNVGLSRYGNKFDIEEFIDSRYRSYQNGYTTVLISNIESWDEIANLYSDDRDCHKGERIKSRICEMCDFVIYNHPDRRKENVTPPDKNSDGYKAKPE